MTTELDTLRASSLSTATAADGRRPVLAYLARLRSDASRRSTAARLRLAAAMLTGDADADPLALPWHNLDAAAFAALASRLAADGARADGGTYSARSVNATLAAVRGVLRECWRAGMIGRDELARVVDVRAEPVGSTPAGRALDAGELDALARSIQADPVSTRAARDAALLALLYGAGLRAAEAVAVHWSDLDDDAQAIRVRRGKGRKDRRVGLASGALEALQAWRARVVDDGPILQAVDKGGRILPGGWSTRGIGRACARLARAAAVEPFTPHDMRRSYAGDLLEAGADLVHVQGQLGHASPTTTAGYDRRPDAARFAAARRVRLPYRRRIA